MFSWGLGGGIMMIIFWAAIILFIVWIVREVSGRNNSDKIGHRKSTLEILEERYAKGEIDKKEFEEKKKDLSN
ncbi:MAG: SHOCT domain-containing protein [Patescibacteria group bacterium]|nr:SHOCT domain-containing protein [Patescibacteria group bacterium]